MFKTARHRPKRLEVTIMFDPHRRQHDLLQTAYALLVPLPRRRLPGVQPASVPSPVPPPPGAERSVS
jgi:hypothetical protein